ncbi:MAG TPA: hypothetical protein VGR01_13270 [Burkholderiales bacterium]|jgi:hypothetical protein|nr:hypothetical protein [Burkholderiales bacterium]
MTKHITLLLLLSGLSCSSAVFAAEPLGRLFFSPAQRNALDAGKKITAPRAARAPAAPRGPREVTLNGVVTRSDGESTVWVNGRALDERPASGVSASASGSDPAAARLKLGGARDTVQMRVGQRLERSTGKIAEPYESVTSQAKAAAVAKRGKSAARPIRASKSKAVEDEAPVTEDKDVEAPTVAR